MAFFFNIQLSSPSQDGCLEWADADGYVCPTGVPACSAHISCSECAADAACGWCAASGKCLTLATTGPPGAIVLGGLP